MEEYNLLITKGNIGHYNSCEITELVIMESNIIYNLYTLCVFQENKVSQKKYKHDKYLKKIKIDKNHSLAIFQYELKINEVKENFEKLINENRWISNHRDESSINYNLRKLNKQFISSNEKNRLNYVLKNNFYSGSYILELFDEDKDFEFLMADEKKFEKIFKTINEFIPINLFQNRDRLGNFIFQFPVNILEVKTTVASDSRDSLFFHINWHPFLNNNLPDCILEVESNLDKNIVGSTIEEYTKNDLQELYVGNVDSLVNVKIWRKNPSLLLYFHSGYCNKSIEYRVGIGINEKRFFTNRKNEKEFIDLTTTYLDTSSGKQEYFQFINNSIGIKERALLEKKLSFKQYTPFHNEDEGLDDLRSLIKEKGGNGIYLWDPYLSSEDIVEILFYCPFANVELKALGSVNKNVRKINTKRNINNIIGNMSKEINSINNFNLKDKEVLNLVNSLKEKIKSFEEIVNCDNNEQWINEQINYFKRLKSNFEGLNLEFRVQVGKSAHDRFLIFPGNSKRYEQPQVYSLGTSINSFGNNYHILQKVLYPQAVIREFNKIWDESKQPENLIWKYPK